MKQHNIHDLRPKEGYVMVCEGEADRVILREIIARLGLSGRISVFEADGVNNVANFAAVMRPSIYIRDRDADFTLDEAHESFVMLKPRTIWTHYDIEGYILYPDWLLKAGQTIFNDQKPHIQAQLKLPASAAEIETTLLTFMQSLVPEYAGKRAITRARNHFSLYRLRISGDYPNTNELESWKTFIAEQVISLDKQLKTRVDSRLQDFFEEELISYTSYTLSIDESRAHFSGKIILQHLTDVWNLNIAGVGLEKFRTKCFNQLYDELPNIGDLHRHPRYIDFARLIRKLTLKK
jgi:hypothetical protein